MTEQPMVTTSEAARRLRVDPSTITRRVQRGELQPALVVPGYNGDLMFAEAVIASLEEQS